MEKNTIKKIIEGALLAYGQPLSVEKMRSLFIEEESSDADLPSIEEINSCLESLQKDCEERGYELKKVSSGWRFQVKADLASWVNRLWEEKPQKYSRALLETLSIIAYRQPITRGDIEEIRGVAVSSNIIKTLTEREWVKVVGHRDVPGRPALFATTKQFLDYFNLETLESLPTLRELTDIDSLTPELALVESASQGDASENEVEPSAEIEDSSAEIEQPLEEAEEVSEDIEKLPESDINEASVQSEIDEEDAKEVVTEEQEAEKVGSSNEG